jgi:hypothetical protein
LEKALRRNTRVGGLAALVGLLVPTLALAQGPPAAAPLVCGSRAGERQVCPGDTSAGVALMKSTGVSECLLGKTWGYDDKSVWVADGCSGEFQLGQTTPGAPAPAGAPVAAPASLAPPGERIESWGEFTPGKGFLVGKGDLGALSVSGCR